MKVFVFFSIIEIQPAFPRLTFSDRSGILVSNKAFEASTIDVLGANLFLWALTQKRRYCLLACIFHLLLKRTILLMSKRTIIVALNFNLLICSFLRCGELRAIECIDCNLVSRDHMQGNIIAERLSLLFPLYSVSWNTKMLVCVKNTHHQTLNHKYFTVADLPSFRRNFCISTLLHMNIYFLSEW